VRDGDDWQDVRPRRLKALRQEELGQDSQRESRWQRQGRIHGYDNQQSRSRVLAGSRRASYGRGGDWEFVDDRSPIRLQGRRSRSRLSRWQEENRRAAVSHHGQLCGTHHGKQDDIADSSLKQFVTFYFTNFPPQLSNFYLRKRF